MTEEISVGESGSGREVILRYEKGKWWVVLGEEYVRGLWPKSRAVQFAKSIVTTKLF